MQVGNADKRKMEVRMQIREWIAIAQKENKIEDEMLHFIICTGAKAGWVEELRLVVNVPRSSVELCLNDVKYIILSIFVCILFCAHILICMHIKQLFDIDKKDDDHPHGATALHHAILYNNPTIVELLLKEYDANPNVVDNMNGTTLLAWASRKNRNLSILKLLAKYRFDFARLVNEPEDKNALTVFQMLCYNGDTGHNITCLKHLFSICEKIPHCSINILTRNHIMACADCIQQSAAESLI